MSETKRIGVRERIYPLDDHVEGALIRLTALALEEASGLQMPSPASPAETPTWGSRPDHSSA